MTVFKPPRGKTYRYDFEFGKQRYAGNTRQVTQADAELAEREIQLRLRHDAGGIAQFFADETPRIQDWAEVFVAYKRKTLERPEHVETLTGVLLRFFGAKPADPAKVVADEPYHDLRLGDLIADPDWILRFEAWLERRGIGNQAKNHYRGMMRRMYALARRPEYRKAVGVPSNPFLDIEKDPTPGRTVTLSAADVLRLLRGASYHVRLAVAIAALAPKLRLANILALRWGEHFQPDPRTTKFNPRVAHYITVTHHKTARKTRLPLVSPVTAQLLRILKDAWRRDPRAAAVVTYRGKPIKRQINAGVKGAAEAAGLPYGRDTPDGLTFHTLRHSAATLLSGVEADPLQLRDAMGHTDLATTMKYRHMKPQGQRSALERLSRALPIEADVMAARTRARRAKPAEPVLGKVLGLDPAPIEKIEQKRVKLPSRRRA